MVHVVFKHFTDITEIGWMRVTYDDPGDFQGFQDVMAKILCTV